MHITGMQHNIMLRDGLKRMQRVEQTLNKLLTLQSSLQSSHNINTEVFSQKYQDI